MTLTTHIRIIEPTPVRPIFDECRRLLSGQNIPFDHEPERYGPEGKPRNMRYGNWIGQGLHALMWVTYGADGRLSVYEDDNGPAASIDVGFDTTYGYEAPNGAGCADLHAWLVGELGRWLDARGLTWQWENEYTGEWHSGYDALPELGDAALGALMVPA